MVSLPRSILTALLCSALSVCVLLVWSSRSHSADTEINAITNKSFQLVLSASTGSTGYEWSAKFDHAFLRLDRSWREKSKSGLVGAPGKQFFKFTPIKTGKTEIEMALKRAWEPKAVETRTYKIFIAAE